MHVHFCFHVSPPIAVTLICGVCVWVREAGGFWAWSRSICWLSFQDKELLKNEGKPRQNGLDYIGPILGSFGRGKKCIPVWRWIIYLATFNEAKKVSGFGPKGALGPMLKDKLLKH